MIVRVIKSVVEGVIPSVCVVGELVRDHHWEEMSRLRDSGLRGEREWTREDSNQSLVGLHFG